MNILITGASGGMGAAIVSAFASEKHELFLQYRDPKKKRSLQSQYPNSSASFHFLHADLTNERDLQALVQYIEKHGGVDVVIHSVSAPTAMANITDKIWKDFETHIHIQAKSLFFILKQVVPGMMKKRFGRIIALASEYTTSRPPTKLADYITAKYALVGFIKAAAVELGQFGITANCISPGISDTELTSHLPHKLKDIIAQQTPLKRLTTPDDVASLVTFLSSSQAGMITGENFLINGGYIMR